MELFEHGSVCVSGFDPLGMQAVSQFAYVVISQLDSLIWQHVGLWRTVFSCCPRLSPCFFVLTMRAFMFFTAAYVKQLLDSGLYVEANCHGKLQLCCLQKLENDLLHCGPPSESFLASRICRICALGLV